MSAVEFSQIQQPVYDLAGDRMRLSEIGQQQEMNKLKLDEAHQAFNEHKAVTAAFQQGGSATDIRQRLIQAGASDFVMKFDEHLAKLNADQKAALASELTASQKISEINGEDAMKVLSAPDVNRPQVYQQIRTQHPDWPEQYDENVLHANVMSKDFNKYMLDRAEEQRKTDEATQRATTATQATAKFNAEQSVGFATGDLADFRRQRGPKPTDPKYDEIAAFAAYRKRMATEGAKPSDAELTFEDFKNSPALSAKYGATRIGFEKWQNDEKIRVAGASKTPKETPDLQSAVSTTRSGLKYIDSSQFTGEQRNALVDAANKAGIPAVSKDTADLLSEIDNARENLDYMIQTIGPKLAKGPTGRPVQSLTNTIEQLAQTDPDLAAVGTYRSAAIQAMRAVAGAKGLRINRAEIEQAQENDIPKMSDTLPAAQKKLESMMKFLGNAERAHLVKDRSAAKTAPDPLGIR